MTSKPKCLLCSGSLVQEKNVRLQTANAGWLLAWVCRNCSAAYPVAVRKGGVLRDAVPLYSHGERSD